MIGGFFLVLCYWVGFVAIATTLSLIVLCMYVEWRDRTRAHQFDLDRCAVVGLFDYEQQDREPVR